MTGGMGAYSPVPFIDEAMMERMNDEIIVPWLKGCEEEGIDYRGIIYPGLKLTKKGPVVLEFNARFGDPEIQVYLARLENNFPQLLMAAASGGSLPDLQWNKEAASTICVVLVSMNYPASKSLPAVVFGLERANDIVDTKVFHAGTTRTGGLLRATGGRVFGVTSSGPDLHVAKERAYQAAELIKYGGKGLRKDISKEGVDYLKQILAISSIGVTRA
jgi:phosphoribosylamine--glycine ligase